MSEKLKDWVSEEIARMPEPAHATLQELQAGLDRTQAMQDRLKALGKLAAENDLDGLCRETRDFAADYGFSVE